MAATPLLASAPPCRTACGHCWRLAPPHFAATLGIGTGGRCTATEAVPRVTRVRSGRKSLMPLSGGGRAKVLRVARHVQVRPRGHGYSERVQHTQRCPSQRPPPASTLPLRVASVSRRLGLPAEEIELRQRHKRSTNACKDRAPFTSERVRGKYRTFAPQYSVAALRRA